MYDRGEGRQHGVKKGKPSTETVAVLQRHKRGTRENARDPNAEGTEQWKENNSLPRSFNQTPVATAAASAHDGDDAEAANVLNWNEIPSGLLH